MKKMICTFLLGAVTLTLMPAGSFASIVIPVLRTTDGPDPSAVKAAIAEFKSLSKKERKERAKEAKKQLKHLRQEKKAGKSLKVEMAVLIILSILLPPLAVYLHQDEINSKFWISVLLTILFWLPGIIYALLVVTDSI